MLKGNKIRHSEKNLAKILLLGLYGKKSKENILAL